MRRLVAAVLLAALTVLSLTPSANAQADVEIRADFGRAAAYWNASPACSNGVEIVHDNAFVAPNAARAAGCTIWVSDWFLAASAPRRCAVIVHEWGHLLGHLVHEPLPDDPLGVMISDAMPESCASALDAHGVALTLWNERRIAREDCSAAANGLSRRVARVRARAACVKRLGRLGQRP